MMIGVLVSWFVVGWWLVGDVGGWLVELVVVGGDSSSWLVGWWLVVLCGWWLV